MIRCIEAYEEIRLGDIGKILKVDTDGLHDLNIQAAWQQKGSAYWVRFTQIELMGYVPAPIVYKVGMKVRVRQEVTTPKYVRLQIRTVIVNICICISCFFLSSFAYPPAPLSISPKVQVGIGHTPEHWSCEVHQSERDGHVC